MGKNLLKHWYKDSVPCRSACPADTDIPGYLEAIYNNEFDKETEDRLPMLFRNTLTWRLRIQGFIVSEFPEQKQEAMNKLTSWFKDGKLKYKEDVVEGLENVVEAFRGLLKGKNFGKLIIKLADEPN